MRRRHLLRCRGDCYGVVHDVHCGVVLCRKRGDAPDVQRWVILSTGRDERDGRRDRRRVQRGVLLPRWVNFERGRAQRRRVHVRGGHLLCSGRDDNHVLHGVHGRHIL